MVHGPPTAGNTRGIGSTAAPSLRQARPGRSPAELWLFLHALRLARSAQRFGRSGSLVQVAGEMTGLRSLPRRVTPAAAERATARACGRLGRWSGARDSCLVRAMVLGTLLSDRPAVVLHVGFRPGDSPTAALGGHAWITLEGSVVPGPETALLDGESVTEAFTVSLRRPGVEHRSMR